MLNKKKAENILLISHEMSYTGAPRSLLNIAKVLQKAGRKVSVWSLQAGAFEAEFEKINIKVKTISDIKMYKNLIQQFDLVILNTFFTARIAYYIQDIVRTILYIREAENIAVLEKECCLDMKDIEGAKEVICVSEYAEGFIKSHCKPEKLTVIHNYVKDEFKGKLNFVKEGKIHFLISGTYEYRKGQDIVIGAFMNMPDSLKKKTYLHIVGRKPDWARDYWANLQCLYDSRIIDHGEISDEKQRIALYEKMNVFIIASRDESCSLVALEGAMLGKALIMSQNVGAQYLDPQRKGIYRTEDVYGLCIKMCELTSRRELLIRGMEMRNMYKKTSTVKIYKKNFLKIVDGE